MPFLNLYKAIIIKLAIVRNAGKVEGCVINRGCCSGVVVQTPGGKAIRISTP